MAKVPESVIIFIGAQVAEGTVNSDVVTATTVVPSSPAGTSQLGVLIRDDSLSWDSDRVEEERPAVPGSFTKQGGDLQRGAVPLSFDTDWKGGGYQTPPAPGVGDFDLTETIALLLAMGGIGNVNQIATQTAYGLEPISTFATIKIHRGGVRYAMQDCKCTPTFNFTPGETASVSWAIEVGSIVPGEYGVTEPDPIVNPGAYGTQESLAAPILKDAGASIGAITRGFLDGSFTFDNEFAEAPDSNATSGVISEQSGRRITWQGGFYVDDGDLTQDPQNLITTGPSTDDLQFQLGLVGDDPLNGILHQMRNLNYTQVSYRREAGRVIWDITAYATDTTPNTEFVLIAN